MLWYKKILLALTSLALMSCGFTPVYGTKTPYNSEKLAAVTYENTLHDESTVYNKPIYSSRKVLQDFSNALDEALNPTHSNSQKHYKLSSSFTIKHKPLLIQRDLTITRSSITISLKYTLTSLETGEVISKGKISRKGEYDQVESDYATLISQQDTIVRVTKELAQGMRLRLISALNANEDS